HVAHGTVCNTIRCYIITHSLIIELDAFRIFLLPISHHLADLLRNRDADLGTSRRRARNWLRLPAAHQFTPRAYFQATGPDLLRATAENPEDLGKKRENHQQMAPGTRRSA